MGSIVSALDLWVGKRLFVPPIIRLCQRTGASQYTVHSYGWMIASLLVVYRFSLNTLLDAVLFGLSVLIGVTSIIRAAMFPEMPFPERPSFRKFLLVGALVILAVDLLFLALRGTWSPSGHMVDIAMLFAEYALTIKTIPPRETETKRVLAREGA
ncbi:MAG: hypothetical protein V4530_06265 [Pseudomonadota bacterium]